MRFKKKGTTKERKQNGNNKGKKNVLGKGLSYEYHIFPAGRNHASFSAFLVDFPLNSRASSHTDIDIFLFSLFIFLFAFSALYERLKEDNI